LQFFQKKSRSCTANSDSASSSRHLSIIRSAFFLFLTANTTLACFSKSVFAVVSPIPDVAPVTIIVFPRKSCEPISKEVFGNWRQFIFWKTQSKITESNAGVFMIKKGERFLWIAVYLAHVFLLLVLFIIVYY
jgi:hypothetical protein